MGKQLKLRLHLGIFVVVTTLLFLFVINRTIDILIYVMGAPREYVEQIPLLRYFLLFTLGHIMVPLRLTGRIVVVVARAAAICMTLILWRDEWILYTLAGAMIAAELAVSINGAWLPVSMAPPLVVFILFSAVDSAWNALLPPLSVWTVTTTTIVFLGVTMVVYGIRTTLNRLPDLERHNEELRLLIDRLGMANKEYMQFAVTADTRSAARERTRITRDIHDTMGYALTNILALSRVIARLPGAETNGSRSKALKIEEQAQDGLSHMRAALRALRSLSVDKVTGVAAIFKLAHVFTASTGLTVRVEPANSTWPGGTAVDEALYHIVQEGLTNALRHGKARNVWIFITRRADGISLKMEDDGVGGSSAKKGIGLIGMEERAAALGGSVVSKPVQRGFRIVAWLPIAPGDKGCTT